MAKVFKDIDFYYELSFILGKDNLTSDDMENAKRFIDGIDDNHINYSMKRYANKISYNEPYIKSQSLIHFAISQNHKDIVEYMINDKRVNKDKYYEEYSLIFTPLTYAIYLKYYKIADMFLDSCTDIPKAINEIINTYIKAVTNIGKIYTGGKLIDFAKHTITYISSRWQYFLANIDYATKCIICDSMNDNICTYDCQKKYIRQLYDLLIAQN